MIIIAPQVEVVGIERVKDVLVFECDGQGNGILVNMVEELSSWSRIIWCRMAPVVRCAEIVGSVVKDVRELSFC